jgi:hypothetical protein
VFKPILNNPENTTYEKLCEACSRNSAHVFPKVRVADILRIEGSGISDELFRFALQAHFDFVIADTRHMPLFVVEFDGAYRKQADQTRRDSQKDALCERFQLPILRIDSEYVNRKYRSLDLLSWFVEAWFGRKWFDDAQARGEISPDEVFNPSMLLTIPGLEEEFPLWLSAEPKARIRKLWEQGKCMDLAPTLSIGYDCEGMCRGLGYMRIDQDRGVLTVTAMRSQRFPIAAYEILREVLPFQVHRLLIDVQNGDEQPRSVQEIKAAIAGFSKYVGRATEP